MTGCFLRFAAALAATAAATASHAALPAKSLAPVCAAVSLPNLAFVREPGTVALLVGGAVMLGLVLMMRR